MIAEMILRAFSKEVADRPAATLARDPLRLLKNSYPNLEALARGARVLDHGCGYGDQAAALAAEYGANVTGVETDPGHLAQAKARHGNQVRFLDRLAPSDVFDVIVSQNAMEHYGDPAGVLSAMRHSLREGGRLLITFGPPWFAPYGHHMQFFCKIPWLNLLFPESAVMKVRAQYRNDGAQRYEEVQSGLNRMTLRKFERLVRGAGLDVVRQQYTGVRGWNFLTRIPVLRELFTVHVTVELRRGASVPAPVGALVGN